MNGNPSHSNRGPLQKHLLYYSNGCQHSKTFITELKRHQSIYNTFEFINVDLQQNRLHLPNYVKSVPTIIVNGLNRPFVGEAALFWLQTEINRCGSSRNINSAAPQMASPQISEIGGVVGLDDSVFSTIDGNVSLSDGNWSYLGNDPKVNDPKVMQSDSVSKSEKISSGDYEKYIAQRDAGITQPLRRM